MSVLPLVIASMILPQAPATTESPETDTASLVARLASDDLPTPTPLRRHSRRSDLRPCPHYGPRMHGNVPALQSRAAALMNAIDQDQLIHPRTIALDYNDAAMREVIKDLTQRTGCRVTISPVETDWLATRITLQTPAPVPFWSAVDKVCDAGRFGSNLGGDAGGATVAIFRGYSTGPVSDHGPFRVQLAEIRFQGRYRQLHLGRYRQLPEESVTRVEPGPALGDDVAEKSFIKAHVNVEPRMLLRNAGKLKDLTAEDDLGQSLIPSDPLGKKDDFEFGFTPAASTLAGSRSRRARRAAERSRSCAASRRWRSVGSGPSRSSSPYSARRGSASRETTRS